jgi:hypothetical protein
MTAPPKKSQVAGAADVLREVLAKVDAGELEAPGRRGAAIVRRLHGVLLGLDVAAGRDP